MHQISRRALAFSGLFTLGLALILGGCAGDRSSSTGSAPASPADAIFFVDSSARVCPEAQGKGGTKGSTGGDDGTATFAGASAPSVTVTIDGSKGGSLALGRYSLTVPAGAFPGTENITLEVANNGYVECHLYPEGLTFDVPVLLTMDLQATVGNDRGATIFWHDTTTDTWVDQSGVYRLLDKTVTAELHHFSDYRAGRAGW